MGTGHAGQACGTTWFEAYNGGGTVGQSCGVPGHSQDTGSNRSCSEEQALKKTPTNASYYSVVYRVIFLTGLFVFSPLEEVVCIYG